VVTNPTLAERFVEALRAPVRRWLQIAS